MSSLSSLNGALCVYCGVPMTHVGSPRQGNWATKDHIVAKSTGGRGQRTVRCCRTCNEDKCHLSINEWRAALSVRHRRPFLFHFEKLAIRVLWLLAGEYANRFLVSTRF